MIKGMEDEIEEFLDVEEKIKVVKQKAIKILRNIVYH